MWSLGKVIDTPEVARVYVGVLPALPVSTALPLQWANHVTFF